MKRMWSEDELSERFSGILYTHYVKLGYTDDSGNSGAYGFVSFTSTISFIKNKNQIPNYCIMPALGTAENSVGDTLRLISVHREGNTFRFHYMNENTYVPEDYAFTGSVWVLSDLPNKV